LETIFTVESAVKPISLDAFSFIQSIIFL
jgi:hypothetical protein